MEHTLQEDLIGKYLSGELSAGEEGNLMAWVNASAQNRLVFEEMVQLWSLSDSDDVPEFPVNLPKAWAALDQRIELGEAALVAEAVVNTAKPIMQVLPQSKMRSLNWVWSAAAAVAVLVLAAWWVFMRDTTPETLAFSTLDNQNRKFTLPDQSQVTLNANSRVSYTFDGDTRKVVLSGEAFFDVEKDTVHPFVIQSGAVQTKVVGTSFSIRAYPEEAKVKVSVKTGKVEVRKIKKLQKGEKPFLVLNPGNVGVYEVKSEMLQKVADIPTKDIGALSQGATFIPVGSPLAEVIPALEKFYNVKIKADDRLLNTAMTGGFTKDMSIEEALGLITYSLVGSSYKLEGDTYVISIGK